MYNMVSMESKLQKIAVENGDRLKVIPIERLKELQVIIDNFKEREELNNFQKWIVDDLYKFEAPEENFKVNSIIIVAVHHPFYAKVNFYKDGKSNTFLSLVDADFNKAEVYLREFVRDNGFSIKTANNLPLKRLGAHSGLAKYGRNNITYIDGLGSNFSFIAYFSDLLCSEDSWSNAINSEVCNKCDKCIESCPTGAIREDRFLIDNQRCLSCINEAPGKFPSWLPITAHHTLYDCLVCQRVCPMNRDQVNNIVENIEFSEDETNMLLDGMPIETFSKESQEKICFLGIDKWYKAIPRNLKTLFEK